MEIDNFRLEGEMLPIFTYPEPILSQKANDVKIFNQELKTLVQNMLFTMYHAPGIGLAAPQVGKDMRLFVIDVDYDRDEIENAEGETSFKYTNLKPHVFINPLFLNEEGKTIYQEGCLSVPGVYEEVERSKIVTVKYQNLNGEECQITAEDLLAICLQHENDHLNGIVFIERLSQLKKNFFKKKLLKDKKRL
jgi:peptide deformylase